MNGGGGYLPEQIGNMSLDQIWFRLCDMEILKRKTGFRTEKMDGASVKGTLKPDEEGFFRGRDKDGNPIKGRIRGKSLNRQLMEEAEARKAKEKLMEKRSKRRERRAGR